MNILRQSTSTTIFLGPFVDDTDAKTPETALSISQADVRLSKNGGAFAQKNNSSSATHGENGYYSIALNATDTNTVGILKIAVNKSGALPIFRDFQILSASAYDKIYTSSSTGPCTAPEVRSISRSNGTGILSPVVNGKTGVYDVLGEWPIGGQASCMPMIDFVGDLWDAICPLTRSSVYYFADDGNDSNSGLTTDSPKQTISAMNTLLASGHTVLLAKNDTWRSTTPIQVGSGAIGSWGSGKKPRITGATITISAGAAWTLASGNRYTITQADCGYIRPQTWPVTARFLKASSTGECESTSNSYFVSGSTLSVNFGGTNPNTVAWEGVTATAGTSDSVHGITVGNGGRVESLQIDHQGFAPGSTNQSWGITSTVSGEGVCCISDCDVYMQSNHNIGNTAATAGGRMLTQRCVFGGNLLASATSWVAYNSAGSQQAIARDNIVPIGRTPTGVSAITHTITGGDGYQAFYAHSASGNKIGFVATLRNKLLGKHNYSPSSFGFIGDCPGTLDDISSIRAIHINNTSEEFSGAKSLVGYDYNMFVGCHFNNKPHYDSSVYAINNTALRGWAMASSINFDWSNLAMSSGFTYSWSNASAATDVSPKFINCHFRERNNTSSGYTKINHDLLGGTATTLSGRSVNCIYDADNPSKAVLTIGNANSVAAGLPFYNNAVRQIDTSSGNETGYGSWLNTVVLNRDPIFGAGSPELYGMGDIVYGAVCEVDGQNKPLKSPGDSIGPWGEVYQVPNTSKLPITNYRNINNVISALESYKTLKADNLYTIRTSNGALGTTFES